MISQVRGTLIAKELDRAEVLTEGGVAYELVIPLGAFEALPAVGEPVHLHAQLVVREDAMLLVGFASAFDKKVFQRLIGASGVGPALAVGLLSALSGERVVRAIREKDLATLQGVPRVGRKTAERIILELGDKLEDLTAVAAAGGGARTEGAVAEDAVRALVSLGYNSNDAEKAVRAALESEGRAATAMELIRVALTKVGGRK
ncbi:MAG TPA: Holliday junction branch migration protein RuvA [Gemmatimonadaceae bacterium]|nr:Holliday junction branch migration protein RuvA [Gemmatimonadaceae bacterium]